MKNLSQIAGKRRRSQSGEATRPKGTRIVQPKADSGAPAHGTCAHTGAPTNGRPLNRDQTPTEDEAAMMVRQMLASFDAYTSKGRRPSGGGLPLGSEATARLGRPTRRLIGNSFGAELPTRTGNGRAK
jgi:hypothetical protein